MYSGWGRIGSFQADSHTDSGQHGPDDNVISTGNFHCCWGTWSPEMGINGHEAVQHSAHLSMTYLDMVVDSIHAT